MAKVSCNSKALRGPLNGLTLDGHESFIISRFNSAMILFESLQCLKVWLELEN